MNGSRAGPSDNSYKKAATLRITRETVTMGYDRDRILSLKGIIVRQTCVLVLFLTLVPQIALAQAERQIYQESSDALYNLDFSIAESGFERLTREHPDNPE